MSTIYYSPVTPIWTNEAIGTLVMGQPGAGKTFFGLCVAANELYMGRRVIVIDPKNDFIKLKNIVRDVEVIDVNKIEPGALNPFTFLKTCDALTLSTIIEMIIGDIDSNTKGDLTAVLQDLVIDFRRTSNPDMQSVISYLLQSEKDTIRPIGQHLRMIQDSKYGPLLFKRNPNAEPLIITPDKSLVISLLGMQLPLSTTPIKDYKDEERFTSAIVYILCKKLYEILSTGSTIPTTFFCDEAHILFANKGLADIIHNFLAMGRSLNIAVVLMSQSVTHFPDSTSQFISNKFVFKSSKADTKEFFNRYDTSDIDISTQVDRNSMITSIANLSTGQCFYMDSKSRSGIIKIVATFNPSDVTSNPLLKKD